ncbi:MAG: hypothetical protein ACPGVN_05620 [Alphaproteobacteria bacterium]
MLAWGLAILSFSFAGSVSAQGAETPPMSISDDVFPEDFSYVGLFEIEDVHTAIFDFTKNADANLYRYDDIFGFNPLMSGYSDEEPKQNTAKRVVFVDGLADMVRSDVWAKIGHHFIVNAYGRLQLTNMIKEPQSCFVGGVQGVRDHLLLTVIQSKEQFERDACIDQMLSFGLGIGKVGPEGKSIDFDEIRKVPEEFVEDIAFAKQLVKYARCISTGSGAWYDPTPKARCEDNYRDGFEDYILPWVLERR